MVPPRAREIKLESARPPSLPPDDRSRYLEDEAGCVARLRAGEDAAFELLFRAYYHPLRAFIARTVKRQAIADELTQDVLVRLWEGRARLNFAGDLGAYLFRAARNRAMNHLRHERIVLRSEGLALRSDFRPGHGEAPAETETRAEHGELVVALRAAVDRLPSRTREAYILRWVQHLSRNEIARIMGISVKGVEAQLTRAIKALKAALAHHL